MISIELLSKYFGYVYELINIATDKLPLLSMMTIAVRLVLIDLC